VAAAALTEDGHAGKGYTLTGPAANFADFATGAAGAWIA
jgi:uncharacterized protein YbjT (DUF2867 family)